MRSYLEWEWQEALIGGFRWKIRINITKWNYIINLIETINKIDHFALSDNGIHIEGFGFKFHVIINNILCPLFAFFVLITPFLTTWMLHACFFIDFIVILKHFIRQWFYPCIFFIKKWYLIFENWNISRKITNL